MIRGGIAGLVVVMLVAGCGGGGSQEAAPSGTASAKVKTPDISNVVIDGDRAAPVNVLAMEAVADLQAYWKDQYPALYDGDYQPVSGGLFASTPDSKTGPQCANSYDDVKDNAFYCKVDDSVTWDAASLLPRLQQDYGDFVIPVVLAHEWGHAIQQRSGFFDQNTVTASGELQADCFAGAWSKHAQDDRVFEVDTAKLDNALAGILSVADSPGTTTENTQDAHGSGFDRASAFQDGYDNGLATCKGYRDGSPPVLEIPFHDEQDAANEGNAPYDSIVNDVPYDIEDYWTQLYPELTDGQAWTPLKGLEPFDPANPPQCGGQSVEGFRLFYCVPDDYVGWDNKDFMPAVYQTGGDYAVTTLLATQWGLAALTRLGDESDEKTSSLRADCLAGGYTASVALYNRKATSSYQISPGDLDEGIRALLLSDFRGEGDVDRQGSGFDRTRAFRTGVIDGAQACLDYGA